MAAPFEVTISHLDGKYVLNNKLSDSVDGILALQDVPWLIRKAASLATPRISVKSTKADDGVTCVEITSTVEAKGLPLGSSNTESIKLDWSPWHNADAILGPIEGKMGWLSQTREHENDDSNIQVKFKRGLVLRDGSVAEGWLGSEDGADSAHDEKQLIQMFLESTKKGWTGETVWGFETVDGQRRYTRRLVYHKGDRVEMARLVYDYLGKVKS